MFFIWSQGDGVESCRRVKPHAESRRGWHAVQGVSPSTIIKMRGVSLSKNHAKSVRPVKLKFGTKLADILVPKTYINLLQFRFFYLFEMVAVSMMLLPQSLRSCMFLYTCTIFVTM